MDKYLHHVAESKLIINRGLEVFLSETHKINQSVDIFIDQFKAYEGSIGVNFIEIKIN